MKVDCKFIKKKILLKIIVDATAENKTYNCKLKNKLKLFQLSWSVIIILLTLALKLSLLKIWSSRLNTLNFMHAISSFFCEHSDLDWPTISSMALFQFSFLAGCAAANASRVHKTKSFMFARGVGYPFVKEGSALYTCMMNEDDRGTTTDANGLGSTVFIRSPIVESRDARQTVAKNTPPLRAWIFFSFGMVRLLRPRHDSRRDYLMREDRRETSVRGRATHATRDIANPG